MEGFYARCEHAMDTRPLNPESKATIDVCSDCLMAGLSKMPPETVEAIVEGISSGDIKLSKYQTN